MLLHIGENEGIPLERILFVLNGENMTTETRSFVQKARRERRFFSCHGEEKAYIVTKENGKEMIHASMIASATLEKRWRSQLGRRELNQLAVLSVTDERG